MKFILTFSILLSFTIGPVFAQQGNDLEENFDNTAQELGGEKLDGLSADEFGNAKEEQKPALKESFVSGMMTGVMKQAVNQFLKENPFSKMDRQEVKSMIEVKTSGLPVSKIFKKNPKLLDMFVDWIRDEKALPKVIGIVNKPDEVKTYSIIVIVIFIISFMLNVMNSEGNLFKRILKKMAIFSGAFIINIGAFLFIFQDELKPSLDIVFKYYHI